VYCQRWCSSTHIIMTRHVEINNQSRGTNYFSKTEIIWGDAHHIPPWAKSLVLTVPGLGLSPQQHTYGSESVPIVQGLDRQSGIWSKCLQNPWGVTLTIEPNHLRRLQDAVGFFFFTTTNRQLPTGTITVGFFFFTTTNQQIPMGTTYMALIFSQP